MKVLAQGVPGCTYAGFKRAVEVEGGTWIWWQEQHTPAFDVFDEVNPDAIFCMETSRALSKCILEFSPIVIKGQPDPFTFDVGSDKTVDFQRLYDAHIFGLTEPFPAHRSHAVIAADVCQIGLQICYNAIEADIKVISETSWPVSQYMGRASVQQKAELYASTGAVVTDSAIEAMRAIACGAGAIVIGDNPDFGKEFDDHRESDVSTIMDYIGGIADSATSQAEFIQGDRQLLQNKSYDFAWKFILEQANGKGQLSD